MELRYYQTEAVQSVIRHLHDYENNPCVEIPTGGGKTPVIATLAKYAVEQWDARVVIVSHVKELLEQSVDKLKAVAPGLDVGVYSAGLGRRDKKQSVIVAGIQSVHRKAFELGPFHLVIVDEAHLIPPAGDGMYQSFIRDLKIMAPKMRVVGLTATPYRMSTGLICHRDNILNQICYQVSVKTLINQGYLCKLRSKRGMRVDLSNVHIRGGEYIESEMQAAMMDVVRPAVEELLKLIDGRKSILVFCAGVEHAETVIGLIREAGHVAELITGETSAGLRAAHIDDFKAGRLRFLVNVMVLTTGFDAPNVDCVAIMRATLSPGLFYQMVGRGFRLSPDKEDCLVLDFGTNLDRHGPVDQIEAGEARRPGEAGQAVIKTCPNCQCEVYAALQFCPTCGHQFFNDTVRHDPNATDAAVLSSEIETETVDVRDTFFAKHYKRNDPEAPPTLRVDYQIGNVVTISEWVCIEHDGFAQTKARLWWRKHSQEPFPDSVDEAVKLGQEGFIGSPKQLRTRTPQGKRWPEIVEQIDIQMPESSASLIADDDTEVPF
jgi:DNA repair protein RadD